METEFVPYLAGDIPKREFIARVTEEVLEKAGVSWNHCVKPPAPPDNQERTQAFQLTVMSFVARAKLMPLTAYQQPVVVMPYCGQPEEMNWALRRMSNNLPRVTADRSSKHILLVPDMRVANQLRDQLPRFGSLHGEMEKGGIIISSASVGQWFVITWRPSILTSQLGNMLKAFLTQDRMVNDGDRESLLPQDPFKDTPSTRLTDRKPVSPESLVDMVAQRVGKIIKGL